METKLAVYQLAAPCTSCSGLGNAEKRAQRQQERAQRRATEGNFFKRNNITVDNAINRVNDLIDLAGGVADIVNKFKGGQNINVEGKTLTPEEARELYQAALAKQQGQLDSYLQNNLTNPSANDSFLQDYLKMQALKKKDNTPLYIGLGIGGVLFITVMIMIMNKK